MAHGLCNPGARAKLLNNRPLLRRLGRFCRLRGLDYAVPMLLVLDESEVVCRALCDRLTEEAVLPEQPCSTAAADAPRASAALLGPNLPDPAGLCLTLRQNGLTGPILLLGAADAPAIESVSEQIVVPVPLAQIVARLRHHLELARICEPLSLPCGRLDLVRRQIETSAGIVRLTQKECELLLCLQRLGLVSRDELLHAVWGYGPGLDTHTLETHIYRLRQKLGATVIVQQDGSYRLGEA